MVSSTLPTFDLTSAELVDVLDEVPFWSAPFGIKLLEHIKLRKNSIALDIGFGTGFPLTELAMRLGNTNKLYGVDPWEEATLRAKRKLKLYGIENVELLNAVAEKLPFADASIDLIISNNGLNNVSDLQQALRECYRVASPGCQFVQSVNLESSMIEFYRLMEAILIEKGMDAEVKNLHLHIHEKRKPLEEYCALIEQVGFKVKNVFHDEFRYSFVDGTTLLKHYFIRLAFLPSWLQIVPEDIRDNIFTEIESRMNNIAERENGFHLTVPYVVIDSSKA